MTDRDSASRLQDALAQGMAASEIALAIAGFGWADNEEVQEALCVLAKDPSDEVRTWAVFSLASSEARSERVLEALRAAWADPVADVQGEALVGLAARGDAVARDALERALARSEPPSGWVFEAILEAPSPRYVDALRRLREARPPAEPDAWRATLEHAIAACEEAALEPG